MAGDAGLEHARRELVEACRRMATAGLAAGQAGNLSQRVGQGMLITPSGAELGNLQPEETVCMSLSGDVAPGQLRPSSEWQLHAAVYTRRPDLNAVAHCHSRYATILACAHRPIPALHYMIAVSGRDEIPLAAYATFGSDELARAVADTLGTGGACLLANHGQVAGGRDLAAAVRIAREVEELAALYWGCLAIGGARVLGTREMAVVREAFAGYGQQDRQS